ncbi:MAG: VCBS repeat-containing protein [Clostridia bacterium]
MMSKKRALAAIAALSCLSAGCGINASPADLLRAPKLETKQEEISQALASYLPPSARLVVPMRPANRSAVSQGDLDGDGQDEWIVFYKQDRNEYEIGTIILKKTKDGWSKLPDIVGLAQDIDYFTIVDVTGDNRKELIIGYRGGQELERELNVYSVTSTGLEQLWKQSYNDMAVGDLDADQVADIAILHHNHEQLTSSTEVYGFSNRSPYRKAQLATEGAINGYEQAIIGQAAPGKNGLFIDAGVGAHSAYTALLILKNGKLQNVFNENNNETEQTFKPYALASEDANHDGIIEIGVQREPAGSEEYAMADMPWINVWHQWDGQHGLKPVMETYAEYGVGYAFRIPERWIGKYTVQREREMENGSVSFLYLNVYPKHKQKLLSILLYKRSDWAAAEESLKDQAGSYFILSEDKDKLIVAFLPTTHSTMAPRMEQEYNVLQLSKEEVKQLFQINSF